MIQAPAWLSYASPAVALLSAFIAATSLAFTSATFRRQGVRVRAYYTATVSGGQINETLVQCSSSGLAPVTILSVILTRPRIFPRSSRKLALNLLSNLGDGLPRPLPGGGNEIVFIDVEPITLKGPGSLWRQRSWGWNRPVYLRWHYRMYIVLSNGMMVRAKRGSIAT